MSISVNHRDPFHAVDGTEGKKASRTGGFYRVRVKALK